MTAGKEIVWRLLGGLTLKAQALKAAVRAEQEDFRLSRKLTMLLSMLMFVLSGTSSALAQLPPEIQADSYLLRAEQALGEGDPARARTEIGKIIELEKEHELDLGEEFHFRYAKAAATVGLPEQALETVVKYLTLAGREGRHYVEALELMNQVQDAIEASKESQEASNEPSPPAQATEQGLVDAQVGAAATPLEPVDRFEPEMPQPLSSAERKFENCTKWKKRSYWKKATVADVVACLNAGASPNGTRKSYSPLYFAAMYIENPEVFKALIAAGANLEAREGLYGRTPLHVATHYRKNPEVIKVLLAAGANLEARDDSELTPLHWAAAFSTPEIIRMLVAAGASLEARDKRGATPLHWSTGMYLTWSPPLENTKALLVAGANPNAQTRGGKRPKGKVLAAAGGTRKQSSGGGGLGALIAGVAVGTALGAAGASEEEALAAGTIFAEQVRTGQPSPGGVGTAGTAVGGMSVGGRCEIPGYPRPPGGVANLGLAWCPSNVDFQVRAFALQAAGAQCAIATGSSSTPAQIQARRREISVACGRLAALGAPNCQCSPGLGGSGFSQDSSAIDRAQQRREHQAQRQEEARQAALAEKRRIEAANAAVLNSNCSCIGIDDKTGEYSCLDGFVVGNNSSGKPLCDIKR